MRVVYEPGDLRGGDSVYIDGQYVYSVVLDPVRKADKVEVLVRYPDGGDGTRTFDMSDPGEPWTSGNVEVRADP